MMTFEHRTDIGQGRTCPGPVRWQEGEHNRTDTDTPLKGCPVSDVPMPGQLENTNSAVRDTGVGDTRGSSVGNGVCGGRGAPGYQRVRVFLNRENKPPCGLATPGSLLRTRA
ncbi:hypothetical protein PhaeoP97_03093 [Phaeobacter porticola]|uniref:Uncharacterized protein n=1 Tax=Phaeobacter porticola TaxID=1844006 RepID=A0A1L3I8J0_9RHOB|nr:hypothetical protein PhaeoP97_03093 [Phaeobacter porticola]